MSRTIRNGSKLWGFKKVRDGRPTRISKSCENNGDCPWCYKNRMYNFLKNKIYGESSERTDLEEQRDELGERD